MSAMSEKIKLKNGQIFELIPMGIKTKTLEKTRVFKVVSDLAYDEMLAILSDSVNIGSIEYITEDNLVTKTYLDCVSLKGLEFRPEYQITDMDTHDIYVFELSTDIIERQLLSVSKSLDAANVTIDYILTEAIPTIVG